MPLSRRQFCLSSCAAGLSLAGATLPVTSARGDDGQRQLRVIAYNVLQCSGWPKNAPLAQQARGRSQMARRYALELALYDPDIVTFSESPGPELTREIARLLGMEHHRFEGGSFPGTLMSRLKVTEARDTPDVGGRPAGLFTRHWGRAVVEPPGGEPLIVHSAHLFPVADPTVRLREIDAMLASMQADLEAGRSLLLLGDLNHGPDSEEYKRWIAAGWVDTFAQVGEGQGLTFLSDVPEYRIDYVLATGPIAGRIRESRPLFEGAFRRDSTDERSFALSDHLPQLAVFDLE
ncbi:Endonuclease/Exonuclease/phosphatase family protein [Maioricimonas rarisocia]|uniref:Endonuclease/Exonuclease/phosphatase family protein n=1 Tax=Maioricimonas rarisocia TaxID=2528026 RepID=A0A517ZDJ3_9PLAN|nr:endonuclease/exonuclease/phosphatase family protein [Maioricimonas rarisocia]QDU40547.1 Endonuclease/Exonuclease/phosphatase family protein [Maioricimonas rarisocia]